MTGDDDKSESTDTTSHCHEDFATDKEDNPDEHADKNSNSPKRISSKEETSVFVNDLYEDPRSETNNNLASNLFLNWNSMDTQPLFREDNRNGIEYGFRPLFHHSIGDAQRPKNTDQNNLTDNQVTSKQANRLKPETQKVTENVPSNQRTKTKGVTKAKQARANKEDVKFRENAKIAFEKQRVIDNSKLHILQNNMMPHELAFHQRMIQMHNQNMHMRQPGPWNINPTDALHMDSRYTSFPHRFPVGMTQNRLMAPNMVRPEPNMFIRPPMVQYPQMSPIARPMVSESRQHIETSSTGNIKSQLFPQGSESANSSPREILHNKQMMLKGPGNPLYQCTDSYNPHTLGISQQETNDKPLDYVYPREFAFSGNEQDRFINMQTGRGPIRPPYKKSNSTPSRSDICRENKQLSPRNRIPPKFRSGEASPNGSGVAPAQNGEHSAGNNLVQNGLPHSSIRNEQGVANEQTLSPNSNYCPENLTKLPTGNGLHDRHSNNIAMIGMNPRLPMVLSSVPPRLAERDRPEHFPAFPMQEQNGIYISPRHSSLMYSGIQNKNLDMNHPYINSRMNTKGYVMDLSANKSSKRVNKRKGATTALSNDQAESNLNKKNQMCSTKTGLETKACESLEMSHVRRTDFEENNAIPRKNNRTPQRLGSMSEKVASAWHRVDGRLSPAVFRGVDPNSVLNMDKVRRNTINRTTAELEQSVNHSSDFCKTFNYPKVGSSPVTIVNDTILSAENSFHTDENTSGHSIIITESDSDILAPSDSSTSESNDTTNLNASGQLVAYTTVHSYEQDGETVTYYIVEEDQLGSVDGSTSEEYLAVQTIQESTNMDAIQESLMIANIQESDLNPEYFSCEQPYQSCNQTYVVAQTENTDDMQADFSHSITVSENSLRDNMEYQCMPTGEAIKDSTVSHEATINSPSDKNNINETNETDCQEPVDGLDITEQNLKPEGEDDGIKGDTQCEEEVIHSVQVLDNTTEVENENTSDQCTTTTSENNKFDRLIVENDCDKDADEQSLRESPEIEIECPSGIIAEVEVQCSSNDESKCDYEKVSTNNVDVANNICHVPLSTVEVECSNSGVDDVPLCDAATVEIESSISSVVDMPVELDCNETNVESCSTTTETDGIDNNMQCLSSVKAKSGSSTEFSPNVGEGEPTHTDKSILTVETESSKQNDTVKEHLSVTEEEILNEVGTGGLEIISTTNTNNILKEVEERPIKNLHGNMNKGECDLSASNSDVTLDKHEQQTITEIQTSSNIDDDVDVNISGNNSNIVNMDVDNTNDLDGSINGTLGDETFYDAIDTEDNSIYRTCIEHEGEPDLQCIPKNNVHHNTKEACSSGCNQDIKIKNVQHCDGDTSRKCDKSASETSANSFEENVLEHLRKTMEIVSKSPPQTVDLIDIAQIKRNLETLTQRIESAPSDTKPLSHSRRVIWDILQLCGSCMILSQVALDRLRSLVGQTVSNHLGFYPDMFIDTLSILFKQANVASTMASNVSDDLFFEPTDSQMATRNSVCKDSQVIQNDTHLSTSQDETSSQTNNEQAFARTGMPNITQSPVNDWENSVQSNVVLETDLNNSNDSLPVLEKEGKNDTEDSDVRELNNVSNQSNCKSTDAIRSDSSPPEVVTRSDENLEIPENENKITGRMTVSLRNKENKRANKKLGKKFLNFRRIQKLKRMKETNIYPKKQTVSREKFCKLQPRASCIRNTMPCKRLKQDLCEFGSKEILHGMKVPSSIVLNYEEANRFCCHVVLTRTPISQPKTINQNLPICKTSNGVLSTMSEKQTFSKGLNRSASESDLVKSSDSSVERSSSHTISYLKEKSARKRSKNDYSFIHKEPSRHISPQRTVVSETESSRTIVNNTNDLKMPQQGCGHREKENNLVDIGATSSSKMTKTSAAFPPSAPTSNVNDSSKLERSNIFSSDIVSRALGERARLLREEKGSSIVTGSNVSLENNRTKDNDKMVETHEQVACQGSCNKENHESDKSEIRCRSPTHIRQPLKVGSKTKRKPSFEELLSMPDRHGKTGKSAIRKSLASSCHYIPSRSTKGNKDRLHKNGHKSHKSTKHKDLKLRLKQKTVAKDQSGGTDCKDRETTKSEDLRLSTSETIASLIREDALLKCHDSTFLTGLLSSLKERLGQSGNKISKENNVQMESDKTHIECESAKTDYCILEQKNDNSQSSSKARIDKPILSSNDESVQKETIENRSCGDSINKDSDVIHPRNESKEEQKTSDDTLNIQVNGKSPNNESTITTSSKESLKRYSSLKQTVSDHSPSKKAKSNNNRSKTGSCERKSSKERRRSKKDKHSSNRNKEFKNSSKEENSNGKVGSCKNSIRSCESDYRNDEELEQTQTATQACLSETVNDSVQSRHSVLDSGSMNSSEHGYDSSSNISDGLEHLPPPRDEEWTRLSDLYNVKSMESSDDDDKGLYEADDADDGVFSPLRFCMESGDELPPLRPPVKRRRPPQKVRCLRVDVNTHKEIQNILRDIVPQTQTTNYEDESDDDDARTVTDFSYLDQPQIITKPKSTKKRWDRISICNNTARQIYSHQDFFTPVAGSIKPVHSKGPTVEDNAQDQALDSEIIPAYRKRGMSSVKECFSVLDTVYNHSLSEPFRHEVKSKDVPDYYKIIKRGMCYDIIAHKLRNSIYEKFDEFVDDMKLIFSNCYQYHQSDSEIYQAGKEMEKFFHQKMMEFFPDYELEVSQVDFPAKDTGLGDGQTESV